MPRIDQNQTSKSPSLADRAIVGLRAWLAAMYAATIWVTPRLWMERAEPPLLPWVELPPFDGYGELLLATACLFVVWPRLGLIANVLVGVVAMTADQTRMQPQIFSFWLLMLGSWPKPAAQLIGRAHLSSLWLFSGIHKLLSEGYFNEVAPWLWNGIFAVDRWPSLIGGAKPFAAAIATVELLLGVLLWWRPARRPVAAVAALLHIGIVIMLASMDGLDPAQRGWNSSVWGWNLALAGAALVFVGLWQEPLSDTVRRSGRYAAVAAGLLVLLPLLYYAGRLDAYLCHCLYSANVPTATFIPGRNTPGAAYRMQGAEGPYWKNLNVPQPPTHRNFEIYFRRVARPGDMLLIEDPRIGPFSEDWKRYAWRCTEGGVERIPLP
jgi:uncharacterized membrane protein YphA (DoxX/SURF4 family)